ncbi:MAG: immunoglobulin domain-containing protein [Clostridia bacterium]|nr:immunoglobulin domain-containing protein [Clostridia bacterium]
MLSDVHDVTPVCKVPAADTEVSAKLTDTVRLEVSVDDAYIYAWERTDPVTGEESPIQGAESATLDVEATGENNGAKYRCFVFGYGNKSIRTPYYTLNVNMTPHVEDIDPPRTQWIRVDATAGDPVTFSVTAKYAVSYQWFKAGAKIDGETEPSLTFTPTNADGDKNYTEYYCRVYGMDGQSEASATWALYVQKAPAVRITAPTQAQNVSVVEGQELTCTVTAENAAKYQWYKTSDGTRTAVPGATGSTLTLSGVTPGMEGQKYLCQATGKGGDTADSPEFTVQVVRLPVFKRPAKDQTVNAQRGTAATLSVVTDNAVAHQWYIDRGNGSWEKIDGATDVTYITSPVSDANDGYRYYCEATSAAGTVKNSSVFTLRVKAPEPVPKTGDENRPLLFAGLAVIAVTGIVLLRKKARGLNGK